MTADVAWSRLSPAAKITVGKWQNRLAIVVDGHTSVEDIRFIESNSLYRILLIMQHVGNAKQTLASIKLQTIGMKSQNATTTLTDANAYMKHSSNI